MDKKKLYDSHFERISTVVRKSITDKVNLQALGNSNRNTKDLATDLVNHASSVGMTYKEIAAGCFLCPATVQKLAEGKTKRPLFTTVDSVLRYFELEMSLKTVKYRASYLPGPVEEARKKKAGKKK